MYHLCPPAPPLRPPPSARAATMLFLVNKATRLALEADAREQRTVRIVRVIRLGGVDAVLLYA